MAFISPQNAGKQPLTDVSDTKKHNLADTQIVGKTAYVYVQAGGTLTAADVVAITNGVTSAGTGYTVETGAATGKFLWIRKTADLI